MIFEISDQNIINQEEAGLFLMFEAVINSKDPSFGFVTACVVEVILSIDVACLLRRLSFNQIRFLKCH